MTNTDWEKIKGKIKQRFGQLTDDDLTFIEGKGQELMARLREKLHMSEDQLQALFEEIEEGVDSGVNRIRQKASEFANQAGVRASAFADEAKAQAGAALSQARTSASGFWSDAEDYVRQNPRDSLIAAVFAGFVAGLLIRR